MYVVAARFKQNTWDQNSEYRRNKGIMGCIYGSATPLAKSINYKSPIYALELNFTEHKIMGIGLFINDMIIGKYNIYSDSQFNNFYYKGKYRVDRSDFNENEEEFIQKLDDILFWKCKRWRAMCGMTQIPKWVRDLPELNYQENIKNIFISRFRNNQT